MDERLRGGEAVRPQELETIDGALVRVPDPGRLVHLQFRRFAGCPVCTMHLRSVVTRHDEIVAAGVREVVLFHSPVDELRPHVSDLPFEVVPDPDKRVYREFGVEAGARALLDPRSWGPILRAIASALWRRDAHPSSSPRGGRLGLPADFLIDGSGRITACKYGEHLYDQWSVDELLALATAARAASPS